MKRSFDLITMPVTPVERRQEERLAAFYEALKPTRPDLKIPASLDLVIQKFLLRHEARPLREDAPRILVVQAGPGVGKSHACIDVPLRRGWNVISEGSSTFLGETEMSGSAPYKAMFVNAEKIAHATGVRTCCVVHDFDLILGAERGEVRGPSHRVIAECTQYIASNKSLYCNVDGSCIPLLVNGNNFTGVRSSVFRDQRAHWETVEITLPEKMFLDFMKSKGKVGGQHKFPRVLKGKMLEDWNKFLNGQLVG